MTPQYAGLRALYEDNKSSGFAVMGFPCNQFGEQEPGSDAEILEFVTSKYDVTFPMFSKIEVNGGNESELYTFLKSQHPDAEGMHDIKWNFTKFLVGRDGQVLQRFSPLATPEEIAEQLPQYL